MRIVLLLLLFTLAAGKNLMAQDTIVLKNGETIQAKIIEVNETSVSYKKYTYQDGPLFIISKSRVDRIRYADGSVDTFSESAKNDSVYPRNLLSIDPLALAFGNIALSYEHFGKRGKWSFRIPLSFAIFDSPQNRTGGAFDVKYYPWRQGKARYYLGPSLSGVGGYNGYFTGGLMFINGVSLQPVKAFNITLDGGFGVGHVPVSSQRYIFINGFIWRAGISLGWRF
jgi:hypothetical protein